MLTGVRSRTVSSWIGGVLLVSVAALQGCEYFPESTFTLSGDSRMPQWVVVPAGKRRTDVELTMSYYIKPSGSSAVFILKDTKGHFLAKVSGRAECAYPIYLSKSIADANSYPSYQAITAQGITEMIEHKTLGSSFYVTDDASVWKKFKTTGCAVPKL